MADLHRFFYKQLMKKLTQLAVVVGKLMKSIYDKSHIKEATIGRCPGSFLGFIWLNRSVGLFPVL